MRELKFRFWDTNRDCFHLMDGWSEEATINGMFKIMTEKYSIISMQYTGLKDKNGKEIYEGDIVKYLYKEDNHHYDDGPNILTSVVKFENGAFYPIPSAYNCEDDYYSWKCYNFEILGNIYENPELLTKK